MPQRTEDGRRLPVSLERGALEGATQRPAGDVAVLERAARARREDVGATAQLGQAGAGGSRRGTSAGSIGRREPAR